MREVGIPTAVSRPIAFRIAVRIRRLARIGPSFHSSLAPK
jgi:hypothetical protein